MKIVTQIASFLIKFVGDVLLEIVAQIASFLIVFVGEMPLEIVAKIASFLTDRSNRPILTDFQESQAKDGAKTKAKQQNRMKTKKLSE